jgi:hypothetical protein
VAFVVMPANDERSKDRRSGLGCAGEPIERITSAATWDDLKAITGMSSGASTSGTSS